jgi:hypothetical protein
MAPLMQPLALAGAVTDRSDSTAIAHAKVLVMFFSEGSSGGFTTPFARESSFVMQTVSAAQRHDFGALPARLHIAHRRSDLTAYAIGRAAQRIGVKVRVACRRTRLCMLAESRAGADARMCMAKIVQPNAAALTRLAASLAPLISRRHRPVPGRCDLLLQRFRTAACRDGVRVIH